jgi:tetratricopeptide (TPR) repeat protein
MNTDQLQSELEQRFTLEELVALAQEHLGVSRETVGGSTGLGSFVRALSQYCSKNGITQALLDAAIRLKPQAASAFETAAHVGLTDPGLEPGTVVGRYSITRTLGVGPCGRSYAVSSEGTGAGRLKWFNATTAGDVAGMARYLAYVRYQASRMPSLGIEIGEHAGRPFLAHRSAEGTALSELIADAEPMSFIQATGTLRPIVLALGDLHDLGLCHGNLKPENIVLTSPNDGVPTATLLDGGLHYLRLREGARDRVNAISASNPKTVAPEVLTGHPVTAAADLYSLGVILFELLTGSYPFAGSAAATLAVAHLSQEAPRPSELAPSGGVSPEVDDLVLSLLAKHPEERPASARKVLELMENLQLRRSQRPPPPRVDVEQLISDLHSNPSNAKAALALEGLVEAGADAREVAFAFRDAASTLDANASSHRAAKLDLGFRAARLLRALGEKEDAEAAYVGIVELDAGNRVATAALEDLRLSLGKHEALIEMWLGQHEAAEDAASKALALGKIGALYERELGEPSQALVAYCQTFCTQPSHEHAQSVERIAGQDLTRWQEAIQTCSEHLRETSDTERRNAILVQLGDWYASRVHRADLAVQCYQAVIQSDPSSARALDGLSIVLRRAQQWPELAQLLSQRAAAAVPPHNRDYLIQSAQLWATQLNDKTKARSILEQVLEADPLHAQGLEALQDLYQQAGDMHGYARLLERQAEHSAEADRVGVLCRLAGVVSQNLGDLERASALYERVLQEVPDQIEALQGLEAIQERGGKFRALVETLNRQLGGAATPRQKVRLLSRLAELHEQEFLDPGQALRSLEQLITIDPKNSAAFAHLERLRRDEQNWSELASLYETHAEIVADPTQKASLLIERAKLLRTALASPIQAIETFERALKLKPDDPEALAGLAELRQASGDAAEALRAIQQLARNAPTPESQADNYVRAAQLLLARKDLAGAVEHYQLALEAMPSHSLASAELRRTYVELGDPEKAISLLYELVEPMPVGTERAKLTGELARLLYQHTEDWDVATETAEQALEWNDSSVDALFVLGAIAFSVEEFEGAFDYLSRLAPYVTSLPRKDAVDSLLRYAEAASRTGAPAAVLSAAQKLAELAPDELDVQRRLAELVFDNGQSSDAEGLYKTLLDKFGARLPAADRAELSSRYAECVARSGRVDLAISLLEEASDLDPKATKPLESLAAAYIERGNFNEAWEVKQRLLDLVLGDRRIELLIELGELAAQKLGDRDKATSYLVMALDERPSDRNLLTRLMQLYTEEKDWARLVDVVLKLADFVTDDKQKAKYLMTAGMVSVRELQDKASALDYFERVLSLDPSIDKALVEGLAILEETKDHDRAERLLKACLRAATRDQDAEKLRDTFVRLGNLYKRQPGRSKDAIEAYEAANGIDSSDKAVWHELSELYSTDTHAYFEKARTLFTNILIEDPYRAEAYKALRKVYTEVKNADGAWCLCQALAVLKLAQPDEERFYRRMRSDDPAYAQSVLSRLDYQKLVSHESADPLLSEVFAIIEPAIVGNRGYEFHELGYDPNFAVDLAQHPHPIGQTLHYAAGVLGMEPPPAFDNTNDPGGLAFLDTKIPSISMGLGVLSAEIHPQALAFLAGRHLTYYRPGCFLRQLVGTGTGLKAWLFAAVKLISPAFPIASDLEGAVTEHLQVLRDSMPAHARDDLARAVSKLLQNANALDLRAWVNAVDFTADRIGFVLAHDLETAVEVVRSTEDDEALARERVKQLVLYSIGPAYLELRRHLKIDLNG